MGPERHLERAVFFTRLLRYAAFGTLALSMAALSAAVFWPIPADGPLPDGDDRTALASLDQPPADAGPLIDKLAARSLIKATQAQAAVRDTGVSKELLKRLKLQGVVQMPDEMVAYIAVAGEGVCTCRKGERVLEFVIEDIAPGKVVLDLQGVKSTLTH